MKRRRLINIHTHITTETDVPARVKEWESWGCEKWCALADPKFWQPPYSVYMGNEAVLKWMKEFPEVIIGMGSVELGEDMGSTDDIDRLKEQGFSGLKFEMPSHPYDHDRYMPLYERAKELGMPILFHTGLVAALPESDARWRPSSESMRAFRLERIARVFPGLQIIGAHLGMPHAEEALSLLDAFRNVHFDMCGYCGHKSYLSLLKKLLSPFPGADMSDPDENLALGHFRKMVFGSDTAHVSLWYEASEEVMDFLQIPDETRDLYYWGNAAKIFGIE